MRSISLLGVVFALFVGGAASRCDGQATTTRVSVGPGGVQANGHSYSPCGSADMRYIVFASDASNLVPDDVNGYSDIFVRDTVAGTTACVSVNAAGKPGNWYSLAPCISANGRYIAFHSLSTDLIPGDTTISDIFVRDMTQGTTVRLSIATNGTPGDRDSHDPALSADGRYVAFESFATNLVANDTNDRGDIFVRDTLAGTTTRISVASDGTPGNDSSYSPSISANGRYVAFLSRATNLVPGDTNADFDLFLRDTTAGMTTLITRGTDGKPSNGSPSEYQISADGRYVAFSSSASNLVAGDANGLPDVFRWDRTSGAIARVSVGSGGAEANADSRSPSISADGRYVSFWSGASNLVAGDTDGVDDIFVRDMVGGTTTLVARVSDQMSPVRGGSESTIGANGRYVAFTASCSGLVPGDTNASMDVFVRGPLFPSTLTQTDLALALRIVAGLVPASADNVLTLDQPGISGSGRLDILDACHIARKVTGLEANP